MTKSNFVFFVDITFTLSVGLGICLGTFFSSIKNYNVSDVCFSYSYAGSVTAPISCFVWGMCPLRLLESSLRGHQHIPDKSWLYKTLTHQYGNKIARLSICLWCFTCLMISIFVIYAGFCTYRHAN